MSALSESNKRFAADMMKLVPDAPTDGPIAYYDPDGDCIEFLSARRNFYSERIDDLVTVYYDEKTNEIIGSLVKGVSQFLKKHPRYAILVESGKVRLAHLFIAGISSQPKEPTPIVVQAYRALVHQAESVDVSGDFALNN